MKSRFCHLVFIFLVVSLCSLPAFGIRHGSFQSGILFFIYHFFEIRVPFSLDGELSQKPHKGEYLFYNHVTVNHRDLAPSPSSTELPSLAQGKHMGGRFFLVSWTLLSTTDVLG